MSARAPWAAGSRSMPPLPCLCCGDMAHEGKSPRGVGSRRGGTIPTSRGAGALSQPPLVRLAAGAGLLWARRGAEGFPPAAVCPACVQRALLRCAVWLAPSFPCWGNRSRWSIRDPTSDVSWMCPGAGSCCTSGGCPTALGTAGAGDGPAVLVGTFAALLAFGKPGQTWGPCLGGSRRGNARSWNRPRAAGESASRGRGSPSTTTTTHASQLHPSLSALHPASI